MASPSQSAAGPHDNENIDHIPLAEEDSIASDSAYGDELVDDTQSIASSIYRHRELYGRRYAKYREGEYWGPNDDIQNDQLDIYHHMMLLLLDGKLYRNPLENPRNIADLGTGTGIWAMDMADQNRDSQVTGIDISPTQPEFVPPNCRFELDDVCLEWTFPENHFDFVHIRCLYGCVADWPSLYRQIIKHLEPGGYLEQLEMSIRFRSDDGSLGPDHAMTRWSDLFIGIGEKEWGKTFQIADRSEQHMIDAGFEDVNLVRYKMPVGGWSSDPKLKELGRWNYLHCHQGCEGWALFMLMEIMKWKREEVMILVAQLKAALKDRNTHAYFEITSVYGRKPMVPTS